MAGDRQTDKTAWDAVFRRVGCCTPSEYAIGHYIGYVVLPKQSTVRISLDPATLKLQSETSIALWSR